MTETVYINWLLLAAHFLWISAAAIVLSLLGIFVYLRTPGSPARDFLERPTVRTGVRLSACLILAAVLLIPFKLPSNGLIAVKIKEPQTAQWETITGERLFPSHDLKLNPQNNKLRANNPGIPANTIVLYRDGSARTPFFRFRKGNYSIRFRSWGTQAKGVFPKIKVEFESPDKNDYLVIGKRLYINLTKETKTYSMPFHTDKDTIGRVRITYFNDIQISGTYKGRDVWIDELTIESENPHSQAPRP
ncbi:MAG: hypothetical protein GY940_01345 [bacterium]|nr:hypothetical protein [bacterium]